MTITEPSSSSTSPSIQFGTGESVDVDEVLELDGNGSYSNGSGPTPIITSPDVDFSDSESNGLTSPNLVSSMNPLSRWLNCIQESRLLFLGGPWWHQNFQHLCLLVWRFKFKSCWSLQLYSVNLFETTKVNEDEAGDGLLKLSIFLKLDYFPNYFGTYLVGLLRYSNLSFLVTCDNRIL